MRAVCWNFRAEKIIVFEALDRNVSGGWLGDQGDVGGP
jgi:hypothetical protein